MGNSFDVVNLIGVQYLMAKFEANYPESYVRVTFDDSTFKRGRVQWNKLRTNRQNNEYGSVEFTDLDGLISILGYINDEQETP